MRDNATVRWILVTLATAAALAFLWYLSPGRRLGPIAKDTGVTRLTVWSGWTGHERAAFEEVVAAFNSEHSDLRLTNVSTAADDTKVFRAITGDTPPDLFFIWNYEYIGALAQNEALLPLDDLLAQYGPTDDEFVPAAIAQCRYQGRTYAMPYLSDVYALFWNREHFVEAGLDPDRPPQTLEELLEYARKLTRYDAKGELTRMGIAPFDLFHMCLLMGGGFYDEGPAQVTADRPENVRALRYYCDLAEAQGGMDRIDAFSAGFGEYASSKQEFFAGKVAMVESGQWWPSFITRFAPTLDYGVAPLPHPSDRPDLAGTAIFGGNFACIPQNSHHPGEAFVFLRWTQTREAQALFSGVMHGVPNLRDMLRLPELTMGSRENEAFGAMCEIAAGPRGRAFSPTPVNTLYLRELELAAEFASHGTKTPDEALADVQARVQRELEECTQ